MKAPTLDVQSAGKIDAHWRAANYLSVGQIYLCDNPLLKEPLAPAHIKRLLLGHWGSTPGQSFIYTHLNRVINKYDLDMIYIAGPGHGATAVVAARIWKVPIAKSIPTSARMRMASSGCSRSSRFRAAFPVGCGAAASGGQSGRQGGRLQTEYRPHSGQYPCLKTALLTFIAHPGQQALLSTFGIPHQRVIDK